MIDDNTIQAAIVAKLKANSALVTWLTQFSAQAEIREAQWQGREFVYPAVRVEITSNIPQGETPCFSQITTTIYYYSESDSSKQVNELAGYGNDALFEKAVNDSGWYSGLFVLDQRITGRRQSERVWQAVELYRTNIFGGFRT